MTRRVEDPQGTLLMVVATVGVELQSDLKESHHYDTSISTISRILHTHDLFLLPFLKIRLLKAKFIGNCKLRILGIQEVKLGENE